MKRSAFLLLVLSVPLATVFSRGLSAGRHNWDALQNQQPASNEEEKLSPRQLAEMRADLLSARKEYEAAAEAYQDIAKTDPRNAQLLNKIGVAYQAVGNYPLAERYYKRAIQADGKFGIAWNNLGTLDYSNARYSKAIKSYKKALDRINTKATVYSNLGYAYSANNEIPKALDAFAKAIALDPDIYSRRGSGGSLIEQRSSTDPATLFFLLAKAYAQMGDVDHTVQYLKLARDSGYKKLAAVKKDPAFASVIANRRVTEVLEPASVLSPEAPASNPPESN